MNDGVSKRLTPLVQQRHSSPQQHRCKKKHQPFIPAFVWTDRGSHENIVHDSREFTPGPPDYESGMPAT
jgi:hypothetical protein